MGWPTVPNAAQRAGRMRPCGENIGSDTRSLKTLGDWARKGGGEQIRFQRLKQP